MPDKERSVLPVLTGQYIRKVFGPDMGIMTEAERVQNDKFLPASFWGRTK